MKKAIHTDSAPAALGPYSQAIAVDDFLFVSGQTPINPATGKVEALTISDQTEQVFHNLRAILEAADMEFNNVVKATVFLASMNDFREMNEVYARFFDDTPPARATVEVARLPLDALVEIELIARR